MKSHSLIKSLILLVVISIKGSYAGQNNLPTMYALHINGINTTSKEASDNLESLKLNSQMTSTGKYLKWNVVYNPTANEKTTSSTIAAGINLLDNIIDVGLQKNNELSLKNISKEQYVKAYIIANNLDPNMSKTEYKQLQTQLMPHYRELIKKYGGNNTEAVISEFHKKSPPQFLSVLQLLDEGTDGSGYDYSHTPSSVLLIPHSQGNMYANSLYKYLIDTENFNPKHIAIFGIASPAGSNFGDWPVSDSYKTSRFKKEMNEFMINDSIPNEQTSYVTSCNDQVINTLRTTELIRQTLLQVLNYLWPHDIFEFPGVLSCNVDASPNENPDDILHHNLIQYYLATPKTKTQIIAMINYFAYQLNYYEFKDLVDNMMPNSPRFGIYPQSLAMVIGVRNVLSQQLVDTRGRKIWSKDTKNNKLLALQTPILDNYVENSQYRNSYNDWSKQFGFYLTHYAGVVNNDVSNQGYDANAVYYVVEDKYQITDNLYPFLIYPLRYVETYTGEYGQNLCTLHSHYRTDADFEEDYDGLYKFLYATRGQLENLFACVNSIPNLQFKQNYFIDGKFQRQSL